MYDSDSVFALHMQWIFVFVEIISILFHINLCMTISLWLLKTYFDAIEWNKYYAVLKDTSSMHYLYVNRPSAPSQPDLQQQKSKLEQALRFGSASVESSNDYVVSAESDQRPRSSSAESSDEPSEGASAEALSSS